MYIQETSQNSTPLTSNLIFKAFCVSQVNDEDFNGRMRENELYLGNLRDIHIQRFMDKTNMMQFKEFLNLHLWVHLTFLDN